MAVYEVCRDYAQEKTGILEVRQDMGLGRRAWDLELEV